MMRQVENSGDSRKDIQSNLDTGHALDDTDGDEPDDSNDDG